MTGKTAMQKARADERAKMLSHNMDLRGDVSEIMAVNEKLQAENAELRKELESVKKDALCQTHCLIETQGELLNLRSAVEKLPKAEIRSCRWEGLELYHLLDKEVLVVELDKVLKLINGGESAGEKRGMQSVGGSKTTAPEERSHNPPLAEPKPFKDKMWVKCILCGCVKIYKTKNPCRCSERKTHEWRIHKPKPGLPGIRKRPGKPGKSIQVAEGVRLAHAGKTGRVGA